MIVEDWGLIDYKSAQNKQHQYVEELLKGLRPETLVFCSHPPVVTLGKKTILDDIKGWSGEVVETKRGGQATYHGPGQIIVYPIIQLAKRNKDIYLYLRQLERALILTLKEFNLESSGNPENTGVWISDRKIASIGVAVKRWVTYHGMAINIKRDRGAFQGINPCGMSHNIMTCFEDYQQVEGDYPKFQESLTRHLLCCLAPEVFGVCQEAPSISQ